MTDTGLPAESQFGGTPRASGPSRGSTETILTVVAFALAAVVLLLAGWWGWAAYQAAQTSKLSTPAMRAAEQARAAVAIKPRDASLRVRLAEALATAGSVDEAMGQLKEAVQIDAKHSGAWLDLGILAMQRGKQQDAAEYFKKVLELTEGTDMENLNTRREQAMFYLGQIAVEARQYGDGLRYLKQAILMRRDASDTYLLLARAYQGTGSTDKALENYKIAVKFDPNYAIARYELGMLLKKQGDLLNAAKNLRQSIAAQPGADPPIEALNAFGPAADYIAKARTGLAQNKLKTAQGDAEIALAIDPQDVTAAMLYGQILEKSGQKAKALEVYRQVLNDHPGDKAAALAVARLSAKPGKTGQ